MKIEWLTGGGGGGVRIQDTDRMPGGRVIFDCIQVSIGY